ncbi:hypothetical protein Adt_35134 [Abeliophyllum distichum]|uniref:Uncharacterized protein n=1 Tax=Abeliophyllum distichum TaxID=126358 RepID=A0ABD1QFN6_9LAMI
MAISEGCRECFIVPCSTGVSSLLKFLIISRIRSRCPDDRMCFGCVPDQWRIVDTVERGRLSSLSKEFPIDVSVVGLNGGYYEDPNLNDEANNYLSQVLTMPMGLLLSLVMILQKEACISSLEGPS